MTFAKTLQESLENRAYASFRTIPPDDGRYDGIVFRVTRTLFMFREVNDLAVQGVQIWPKRSVAFHRRGKFERTIDAIIAHRKMRVPAPPRWLAKVETLADLFRELQKRDVWPVVEMLKEDDTALYLGPVVGVGPDWFEVFHYDADGTWERVSRLGFDSVLRVAIGDSYGDAFNDYMRAKNPPPPEGKRKFVDLRAKPKAKKRAKKE